MRPISLVILLYLSLTLSAPAKSAAQAPGTITTVAGGITGEGGPATDAVFFHTHSVAVDATGNLFIADDIYGLVRRVDGVTGVITTVAGLGGQSFGGDGGPATSAPVSVPQGLAFDDAGNLFIGEAGRVRRVDAGADGVITGAPDEIITTVVGTGNLGFSGDGGPATSAQLLRVTGIAFGPLGDLYVVVTTSRRVRRIDAGADGLITGASDEIITTVVGTGVRDFSGDGGPATEATLADPNGVALDAAGNLYVADSSNQRLRRIDAGEDGVVTGAVDEIITTFAIGAVTGVAFDDIGNLYITNSFVVRKVDPTGIITTVAGNGTRSFTGDGGPATSAGMRVPIGLAFDAAGNLYVADSNNLRVRRVDAGADGVITGAIDEIITTVAGGGSLGDGGPATAAALPLPFDVIVDAAGSLYIASNAQISGHGQTRIRRVEPSGIITTVAGGGSNFPVDGDPATSGDFGFLFNAVFDASGNMYVGTGFHRIFRIDAGADGVITGASDEIITKVAGTGFPCQSGDGGPATAARITGPDEIVIDAAGGLLISPTGSSFGLNIRRIDPGADGVVTGASDEIITTVVGTGVRGFFSGDGGPATSAQGGFPGGLTLDAEGNLFIITDGRVRRVDAGLDGLITGASDEIITTVAGGGSLGDGGPATEARLIVSRGGLTFDGGGNLFVSEFFKVRRIDAGADGLITGATDEIITTIGGIDTRGFSGDGGPATAAELHQAIDIALDAAGNLYIADFRNHRVRRITAAGVPFNEPPTAVAGSDQSIHPGQTVLLDASASFDDNTATANLLFAWSFTERPAGSAATLTDAATDMPSFVADLLGTYRLQLVVTDEGGLSSDPDEIVISSANLAPTADAGDDAGGVVGFSSDLDGSGSSDPEDDLLAFSWSFVQTPTGSTATLTGEGTDMPSLVPDLPGIYVVQLVVSDSFDDSTPDTVTITVVTGEDFAQNTLLDCLDLVANLPPDHVTTKGNQQGLTNFISQAITAIQVGDIDEALRKIDFALERTDGCVLRAGPDGNGPGRDWITDCVDQVLVYALLILAKESLSL